jgi:hypothetical protein
MNENAERINGWAAMLGVVAALGSYALTGQIIPGSLVNGYSKSFGYFSWLFRCGDDFNHHKKV